MLDDRTILNSSPLPIARCYLRFRNAREARDRHDAAYYLFEIYLKYAALVVIAAYLEGEARDHRVNAVLKGLQRPSLGEWLRFLRECLRFIARQDAGGAMDPVASELGLLLEKKQAGWDATARLYNALRTLHTAAPSDKVQINLDMLLSEVVSYRNRVIGHGAPRDAEHYRSFAELLGASFPEILRASPFLNACRLVQFDAVQVEDGSRLECSVLEYMGQTPVRREKPLVLPYGQGAPRKGTLYLLGPDTKLRLLDPLLVEHAGDVYFLNEAEGAPEYLSYTAGARHKPSGLGSAQGELFERILGYRVDSSQLGRIDDDLAAAATAAATLPPGPEKNLGDYRLLREVGRGAMGIVFEAVQESLGRRVALKVLPGTFALEPRRVERFYREARAAARVHHPNIVPVYEVGEAEGTHFYAMEFIDGPSLAALIDGARRGELKTVRRGSSSGDPAYLGRVVAGTAELAEGIEKAHQQGLIHRDVKPSNILVDSTGRFILVDFGLVREEAAETITRSGEMVGTLAYMSPEQVSRSRVDPRADVYSLGATLYEALTLRPPFEGGSGGGDHPETPGAVREGGDFALQRAILFEEPARPRKLNPRLHRDLETILLRALEKNPDRRYLTAGEFAADLRRFLRYEPIRARSLSVWTRITRRATRHRGKLAAAGAFLALIAFSGFLALSNYREARRREVLDYEPQVLRAAMKLQLGRLPERVGTLGVQNVDTRGLFVRSNVQILTPELRRDPLEEALRELSTAVSVVPGRPDAYYHLARALLLLGRDEEALSEIDRALACEEDFIPARMLRASILSGRGDADGSRRELERAGGRAESGWQKAWLRAQEASALKDWKTAIDAFGKLVQMEFSAKEPYLAFSVESRLGRGSARLEDGDVPGAIEDFSWAAGQWRESLEPFLLLGKAYHIQGDKERAEQIFESAWSRASNRDHIAMAVAALYQGIGDDDAGLRWAGKLSDRRLRARTRAGFLYLRREWEEAIRALEEAVLVEPRDAVALNLLGWALLDGRKDLSAGRAVFERAVAADPASLGARLGQCAVLERDGKNREARALHEEAAASRPQDPWPKYHHGWFLMRQKEYDGASKAFNGACVRDPTNAEFQRSLGVALDSEEKLNEAIGRYRDAIRYAPRGPWAYSNLGWALFRTVRWDEAEAVLKKSIELGLRLPQPCRVLGELLLNRGDFPEAFTWLEEAIRRDSEHPFAYGILAGALAGRKEYLKAAQAYRMVIHLDTFHQWKSWLHERLFDLFYLPAKPSGLLEEFDRMAEAIEKLPQGSREQPAVLALSALVHLRAPAHRDVKEALRLALRAVERAGQTEPAWMSPPGRYPSYLAILAEAHAENREFPQAVLLLEEAVKLPAARLVLTENLKAYRRSSLPELPSLASVDAALAEAPAESLKSAKGAGEDDRLSYLEARTMQLEGRFDEAARKFQVLCSSKIIQPVFVLRHSECLRSSGKPADAEKTLRETLLRLEWGDQDLLRLWAEISVQDLAEKNLPARLVSANRGKTSAFFEDVRWLLDEIEAGRPIRINCGGEEYRAKDGTIWGRDRFFAGGAVDDSAKTTFFLVSEINGTEDDRLYQTQRWFTRGQAARYRLPLPLGKYRVKLHFAEVLNFFELACSRPGSRVFDILIEGQMLREACDPCRSGLATASVEAFEDVLVGDGLLDLEFRHRVDNPSIAAIEIEQVK